MLGTKVRCEGEATSIKSPSKANVSIRSEEDTPSRSLPAWVMLIEGTISRR